MSPSQQILHVASDLDGYGMNRQLELLVQHQCRLAYEVRVLALKATPEAVTNMQQLGVDCKVLDQRWQRDPFAAVRLAKEIRNSSGHTLHAWGLAAAKYLSMTRRWSQQKPALVSLPNRLLVNDGQRTSIAPGIAIPNAGSCTRADFLQRQLLPADAILIAVGGPLTCEQRIDEAIWYFELVRTLEERVRLLIFGDGPDRHRLERFCRLTSDPGSIRFLGYRADFRELLCHADLFWHTAIASQTVPQSVLEAMAASVPVVVNDGPGSRKILQKEDLGYLVADQDRAAFARHTQKILGDADHANQLRFSARDFVTQQFSVSAMTRAFDNLYHTLNRN